MKTFFLALSASLLALGPIACSGTSDGGTGDADDSGPSDAQPSRSDAGPDATVFDAAADALSDAPTGAISDGGADADSSVVDASKDTGGIDCAAVVATLLGAAARPPSGWLGLDLSNGGKADGGTGSGGLTIAEADILACASSVEPDVFEAGSAPFVAGGRTATFVGDGGSAFVTYNLESRVIWFAETSAPAVTTLSFHSRPGGSYSQGTADGGLNLYVIGFGAGEDGGAGYVTKDGRDFSADWTTTTDDAGASHASAWANEIYDGLMATYAPSVPAVEDCFSTPFIGRSSFERVPACVFSGAPGFLTLGARPLEVFITFESGNHASSMYEAWPGGYPTCATPAAAVDALDYTGISLAQNLNPDIGPLWSGATIGTMGPAESLSNSAGLLASEANTIAGCGGVTVTAPDPGYAAEQWGASGEVELEYNEDSGVAYKLFAKPGYKGTLDMTAYEEDGGTNEYVLAPGLPLTNNGAPVTLDWAAGDAGALNPAITDISNAWLATYCGVSDSDCVQAGDCAIVPDDGTGHSTFTLMTSAALVPYCGDYHPITFVFQQGTSVPSEIYATNPGGK